MVVALLYEMQSPCNCFTLSLSGSDSRKSNGCGMKMMLRWRSRCQAGDDGDHDSGLEMEIKGTNDDGHIILLILIACDVYPLCILFLLN